MSAGSGPTRTDLHLPHRAGIVEMLRRTETFHWLAAMRLSSAGAPSSASPWARLLLREHCTVTFCHSRTRDLEECLSAGRHSYRCHRQSWPSSGPSMCAKAPSVIDVGINRITDAAHEVENLFPWR